MILGPSSHSTYDPADSVVRVRGLCRSLTPDAGVLAGVDLDLRGGEVVGLVGRRGSGKSTLLRALARVDGDVVGSGTLGVPDRVARIGSDPRLLGWRRVLDNVVAGLEGPDALAQGRRALAEVGLVGVELSWPDEITPEERHRVALARALVSDPGLLLADEPWRTLDAFAQRAMHRVLRTVTAARGLAVLMVTNDIHEAITLADRILTLREGRIHGDVTARVSGGGAPIGEEYVAVWDFLRAELGLADGVATGRAASSRGPQRETA
jgi:sulfonate transport system ATP-binding protein